MQMKDVLTNLDKSLNFSSYDLKVIIAIGFSVVMLGLLYRVYSWFRELHKELVQSGEISSDAFVKVSKWPFTLFIIFLIVVFGGLYAWFYMPFNL